MTELTVCITVYNDVETLSRAMESILNQTYKDFKLLIYDDGSSDGSGDVAESFGDSRITVVRCNENKGCLYARAKLIEMLDTEYCMWCDADDKFAHDKAFETAMTLMKSDNYDWINFPKYFEVYPVDEIRLCPFVNEEQVIYSGDNFFNCFFESRTTNFLNSKVFKSELLKKCIPDEYFLRKKYALDDMFFMTLVYFHTKKHLQAGKAFPIYMYYMNVGYYCSKINDCSLEVTRNLCEAYHDCLKSSYLKMTKVRKLENTEAYRLSRGTFYGFIVPRTNMIRKRLSQDEFETHMAVVHEYFCVDGVHVLNDLDALEFPLFVKMFNNALKGE